MHKEKGLSAIALTMLALGTVVGGSFFFGSSIALKYAGPSVLISYILGGILVYFILFSLSEMTIGDPTPGSFRTYSERAFGPLVGFVVGWVYWTGMVLAMSSEAIAVSALLRIWIKNMSVPLLGTIIIVLVTIANLFGVDKLSKLESGLAIIKLLALVGFILISLGIVSKILPSTEVAGLNILKSQEFSPNGIFGIAGSMLIVIFTYAGFEIIGLAASETKNVHKTIPKAILYTVLSLVGLYTIGVTMILLLIPTSNLTSEVSPLVSALEYNGISWGSKTINFILITAILSTMLAAMFSIGRIIQSLSDVGYAPKWIKDKGNIPYRGIIFSGVSMMLALCMSVILPEELYIFLVSSGGFSLLFTYLIIVVTHYKFRKTNGCPPKGNCQLPGFPYLSWIIIASLLAIIFSMPLIEGQGKGLLAGVVLIIFYSLIYLIVIKSRKHNS